MKQITEIIKDAANGFLDNKVLKLSGSLAYSTVFSMAPLLIVVISLCSIFLGRQAAEGKIYSHLGNFLGQKSARQLQDIITQTTLYENNHSAVIVGSIILVVGATSVFAEIQDSINTIWGIKPKPKKSWLKMLQNRLLSFSVLIGLGFILLVSLVVTSLIDSLSDHLKAMFPQVAVVLFYIFNQLITLIVAAVIFGVIFKVLPDARIRWKDIAAGAVVTAALFMLGKLGISFYISKSSIGSTYGAAGSIIVVLLWIYYSSIILYFGAELTKAYAIVYGAPIRPSEYAVTTKEVEIETGKQTVQQKEKNQ